MRQVHRLIYGVTGREHTDVDLLLSSQTHPGDKASSHIDQGAIRTWYVFIGVEEDSPPIRSFRGLPHHHLPRETAFENLRGQVAPVLATQRALHCDPGRRKGLDRRWDVFTAALAGDDELVAVWWPLEHGAV